MLRIPTDSEVLPPLMAPFKNFDAADSTENHEETDSQGTENYVEEWEKKPVLVPQLVEEPKVSFGQYFVISSLFFSSLIAVFVLVKPEDKGVVEIQAHAQSNIESDDTIESEPSEVTGPPVIIEDGEQQFLNESEAMARRFLFATYVDQILPLVRIADEMKGKILDHHKNGRIEPVGITKFNVSGEPIYRANQAIIEIRTAENEIRELIFVRTEEEGLKIDWESWVGWSQIKWEDLLIDKPTEPVLLRVGIKEVNYYNFGFSDDREWRSYRLVSPDKEHALYGYVKRDSELDQKLRSANRSGLTSQTLKVRFPESRHWGSQVLIVEQVAAGWVVDP